MDDIYKEFLSLEDVAEYLGVHINTVYKYMKDGDRPLPTFRISGRILRVKKSELDEWLKSYKDENVR